MDVEETLAVRTEGARRAVAELWGMPYHSQLATAEQRRQWVLDTSPAGFVAQLPHWNALLRGLEPNGHEFYDGRVRVTTPFGETVLVAPEQKDRVPLLERVWYSAQITAENPRFNDERAMRRIGLTVAGGINLVHAFDNGNGRLGASGDIC
ncbi:MAG: hypothetical protein ACRDPW_05755 [Mycobacteriales bacterium]